MKLIILLLCLLPCFMLLYYLYNKDKLEKEPFYILILLFFEGCGVAVLSFYITIYFKSIFDFLNISHIQMNFFQIILKNFIFIALLEEGLKWIFTIITTWKNKCFNHIFDSIVYCGFLSLGFATIENIFYAYSYNNLLSILLRGIISVPCHLSFSIFMGYYLGRAKKSENNNIKYKYLLCSLFIPTFLHFLYNSLLLNNNINNVVFLLFMLFLYILSYIIINKLNFSKDGFINIKKGS